MRSLWCWSQEAPRKCTCAASCSSRVLKSLAADARAAAREVIEGMPWRRPMKPKSTDRKQVITAPPVWHCRQAGGTSLRGCERVKSGCVSISVSS
eukprot:1360806-Prymnesium_polylepis.1